MPLPRRRDAGSSGAPVLNLPHARVKLLSVEEHIEPRQVTRKADGAKFTLDPQFNTTVEVVDDGKDGSDNGVRFYESFRYKQDEEGGWRNQENSKLGALTAIVKPGYFLDDSIPDLEAADLTGFEMFCRIKPKRNPSTGSVAGSTIDWETMMAASAPAKEKVGSSSGASGVPGDDPDWEDIPF